MRLLLKLLGSIVVLVALLFGWGFLNARAEPVVRQAFVSLPGWPAGAPPVQIVLMSDVHLGNATMDVARLSRIVAQTNALKPDLVVIPGDFVAGTDPVAAVTSAHQLAPVLAGLHPRLGVVATLGNHDEATSPGAIAATLRQAGITVLQNDAVVRGPLVLGGVGDFLTGHFKVPDALAAMNRLKGARVVLTHSPDITPMLPEDVLLTLAGHTHCGQIVLPFIGAVAKASAPQYRCGLVREGNHITIVTAGVGTSVLPIRFGAPPDLWLITLSPAADH